jgi:hypothetical protein
MMFVLCALVVSVVKVIVSGCIGAAGLHALLSMFVVHIPCVVSPV